MGKLNYPSINRCFKKRDIDNQQSPTKFRSCVSTAHCGETTYITNVNIVVFAAAKPQSTIHCV